jgi:ankyrin repeat protein
MAVDKGRLDIMKLLLHNTAIDVNLRDAGGRSALEVALRNGNAPLAEWLLDHNVNDLGHISQQL